MARKQQAVLAHDVVDSLVIDRGLSYAYLLPVHPCPVELVVIPE